MIGQAAIAYQAMHNGEQMTARMLAILMRGVSTRNYKEVIPIIAETKGGQVGCDSACGRRFRGRR